MAIDGEDESNVSAEKCPVTYRELPNNTNRSWLRDPCLRRNVWHCAGLCAVTFMNGYDGSLMNGLQPIDEWQKFMGHPTGYRLGLIAASQYLPAIIFSWVADVIADRWGRRPAVWIGVIIVIVGAVVNGAAVNFGMYCGGRVIIGFGTVLCLATAPTLLQEIAHPRYRAKIAGLYTCIYYIASITSSWVCFDTLYMTGHYSWRLPCYLQVIGPMFVLLATYDCPESPRWLVDNGRRDDALQVLAKHHANGDLHDQLVLFEFREIEAALTLETTLHEISYRDFFRGRPNRHRLLILVAVGVGSNWVGNGIISYYLTPTLNQVGIHSSVQISSINAGLQIWNLILSCTSALLADRLGRRFLWMTSNIGMLVSFIFTMALSGAYATSGASTVGLAVIPFLFFYYGFYDIAWTPFTFSYPVEILPYHLRIKGMAIFLTTLNLALVVNTFVNPIALDSIGWKYYGVYIVILVGYVLLAYFCFPETRRLTIEEISEVFEGPDEFQRSSRSRREGSPGKNVEGLARSRAQVSHVE